MKNKIFKIIGTISFIGVFTILIITLYNNITLNNKNKEFNAIEIKKFDGKTVSRCYRVYEDIQKEFSKFCKENSNYKVQDILSMALYEYMKNNKKDN